MRILIETPLFLLSALIEHDLIAPESRLLNIQKRQHGLTESFKSTHELLKKFHGPTLNEMRIGSTAVDPGLYYADFAKYLVLQE